MFCLWLCVSLATQINVYTMSSMFVLMTAFIYVVEFSDATNVYSWQQSDGFCELSGGCSPNEDVQERNRITQVHPKFSEFCIITAIQYS